MAAPPLSHTFESGQADTTVITTGNSATGGNAFNAVTGSPTYSTTQVKNGTLAMKVDTTATYAETHVDWTGLGAITTDVWLRAYCYFTAAPTTALRLFGLRTNAPANSAFLVFNTDGTLGNANAAQTVGVHGAAAVALNQWVRIEWRVVASTTVGQAEFWLYQNADAAIASFDDHRNEAATMVLGANVDGVRWGGATAAGPNSFVFWMDEIAISSTAQIGPLAQSPQILLPDADIATGTWSNTPLFSNWNDSSDATLSSATAS